MLRVFRISFFVAALAVFAAGQAQAGILQFLFPSLKNTSEPDPAQTLQAPFAQPAVPVVPTAQGQPAPQASLPENFVPLDVPHRNSEQVAEWLMMTVSEALTFTDVNYQTSLDKSAVYFNPAARQQFLTFLQEANIQPTLHAAQYNVRSFVTEAPLLLNEGAIEKRYRWLYEVPVMVSYMAKGADGYKKNAAQPVNQMLTLKIQVGRTTDHAEIGKDIIIETWAGTVDHTRQ